MTSKEFCIVVALGADVFRILFAFITLTAAPPVSDCDEALERGRAKVDIVNNVLYSGKIRFV